MPILRGKKLAKKLKAYLKKVLKRLFLHIMNQEMWNIIIQKLLKLFLLVHKIMFQNLSTEMFGNELIAGNIINIELETMMQSLNESQLDEF